MIKKFSLFSLILLTTMFLSACVSSSSKTFEIRQDGIYKGNHKLYINSWDYNQGKYRDAGYSATYEKTTKRYIDAKDNLEQVREKDLPKQDGVLYIDLYLDTETHLLQQDSKWDYTKRCIYSTVDKNTYPLADVRSGMIETLKALSYEDKIIKVKVGNLLVTIPEEMGTYFNIKNNCFISTDKQFIIAPDSKTQLTETESLGSINLLKGADNGRVFYMYEGFRIYVPSLEYVKEI